MNLLTVTSGQLLLPIYFTGRLHLRKERLSGSFQEAVFVPIISQIIFKHYTETIQLFISIFSSASEFELHAFQKGIGMCYPINIFCCCCIHRFHWERCRQQSLCSSGLCSPHVIQITPSLGKITQDVWMDLFIKNKRKGKKEIASVWGTLLSSFFFPPTPEV